MLAVSPTILKCSWESPGRMVLLCLPVGWTSLFPSSQKSHLIKTWNSSNLSPSESRTFEWQALVWWMTSSGPSLITAESMNTGILGYPNLSYSPLSITSESATVSLFGFWCGVSNRKMAWFSTSLYYVTELFFHSENRINFNGIILLHAVTFLSIHLQRTFIFPIVGKPT